MKRRALRRLLHKLEFLDAYLAGVEVYEHGHIASPRKLMQRAIKQLTKAIANPKSK